MSQILGSRPWPRQDVYYRKWYSCWWCGENAETYEVTFDAGTVEPTVGETLTGSSSGDTGVVVSVALESGAWDGTAVGTIVLNSVAGAASDKLTAFEDNDIISGSTGGANMLTLNAVATYKNYGRMYPDTELAFRDGHYWCRPHYDMQYRINDWADWAKSDRIMEDNE